MELEDKETVIDFNMAEEEANIFSCMSRIWTKCEKVGLKPYKQHKDSRGEIYAKEYKCPQKWIKIHKPHKKKILTDEEKKEIGERLQKSRQNQKF